MPKHTRVNFSIDLKGLIASVDGTIPVERLAQHQRAVHIVIFLILVIAQRDVVKVSILNTEEIVGDCCFFFLIIAQSCPPTTAHLKKAG